MEEPVEAGNVAEQPEDPPEMEEEEDSDYEWVGDEDREELHHAQPALEQLLDLGRSGGQPEVNKVDEGPQEAGMVLDVNIVVPALLRFFEFLDDVKSAKTCRLVCRVWNEAACGFLRNHSWVKLTENKTTQLEDFKVLINNRTGPSPFQNYGVTVNHSFTKDTFISFLQEPHVKVTRVVLDVCAMDFQIQEFNWKLLVQHKDSLREITVITSDGRWKHQFQGLLPTSCQLTELTSLTLVGCESLDNLAFVKYVENILSHSSPKFLTFRVTTAGMMAYILTHFKFPQTLTKLILGFDHPGVTSKEDADALMTFNLPAECLTHLEINNWKNQQDKYFEDKMLTLLRKVSPYVRIVRVNCATEALEDLEVEWPKLKHLSTGVFPNAKRQKHQLNTISTFVQYPALTTVGLRVVWKDIPEHFAPALKSNDKIRAVEVEEIGFNVEREVYVLNDKVPSLLMCIGKNFRSVTSLSFKVGIITSTFFVSLKRFFPGLKKLSLDMKSPCDTEAFTGISNLDQRRGWGWNNEEFRSTRNTSIVDLTELEILTIRSQSYLTQNLVVFGLARIPKLKKLTIVVDTLGKVYADMLITSLPHVDVVVVKQEGYQKFSI